MHTYLYIYIYIYTHLPSCLSTHRPPAKTRAARKLLLPLRLTLKSNMGGRVLVFG